MKLDKQFIEHKTYFNNKYVEKLRHKLIDYDNDLAKEDRLTKVVCKYCYYIYNDKVVMNAFSTSNCKICNKEMVFANSDTDLFCEECAKENNICKYCGQEMN